MKDPNIIALDESARHYDKNGHLIVKESVITKEDVNPYYGRDIPDFEAHGLDPDKIYYLYRPLEEIEKALDTFKGKQLLLKHSPVNSTDTKKDITIGSIGSDLRLEDGKLYGDMTFWDQNAIDLIEAKKMEQLSAGYGYDFELVDGEFDGVPYDGIMTNLHGNHVALVERGRIGNDAIICDEQTVGNKTMYKFKKGSMPRLAKAIKMAMDAGFTEDSMAHVAKSFDEAKAEDSENLHEDLRRHFDEATVAKIMEVLGGVSASKEHADKAGDKAHDKARDKAHDKACDSENIHGDLSKHFDEATTAKIMEILGGISASKEHEDKAHDEKRMEDITVHNKSGNETEMVNEPHKAHDRDPEILKDEIRKGLDDLYQARDEVKSLVGHVAEDSAEKVYQFALEHEGISTDGIHPSAFKAMVDMVRKQKSAPRVAMDSAMRISEGAKALAPHIKTGY